MSMGNNLIGQDGTIFVHTDLMRMSQMHLPIFLMGKKGHTVSDKELIFWATKDLRDFHKGLMLWEN